jgi:hypothetical protein
MNKHDIENFRVCWVRFWILTKYGYYAKQWGVVLTTIIAILILMGGYHVAT